MNNPLRRRPLKVRLNRSLFPADLLTFVPSKGVTLNSANVNTATTDAVFKARSGDGGQPRDLTDRDYIDVFVHDGASQWADVPALPFAMAHSLRAGWTLALMIEWDGVNGNGIPGRTVVTWTHEARRIGRRPRVFNGDAATAVWAYVSDNETPITAAALRRGTPVIPMTPLDIHQRSRHEKVKNLMSSDAPPFAKYLSIEGLRGFREVQQLNLAIPNGEPGSGLTIVVGANNAGKSTVWESFDAIARKSKSDVSFSEGRRNRGSAQGIRLSLMRTDGSSFLVKTRSADTSETLAEWNPMASGIGRQLEIVAVPSRRQFQANFGKNTHSQRDWMTANADFSRSQPRDAFTGRLFDLHNDVVKKAQFDDLMESVLGYRLEWTIDLADGSFGSSYYLKVTTGEGVNHTSEGLGDGIISLLFILNAMYDAQTDTLLVIDEPELSLHPQLVRRLGRALAESARERQIVVFTHAPELVSWDDIAAGAEIARVYKKAGDSRIAQASRATVAEITKARRGWRNPHTMGGEANEALFLDDGVIVVEGQEDASLLPVAFDEIGIPLNGDIWGWGSGGKDNVSRIVALLCDLGFARVAAVLDDNVPATVRDLKTAFPEYLIVEIPAPDIRDKPSHTFSAVRGLLDEHGRKVKPELVGDARAVLSKVYEYFGGSKPGPE